MKDKRVTADAISEAATRYLKVVEWSDVSSRRSLEQPQITGIRNTSNSVSEMLRFKCFVLLVGGLESADMCNEFR
jgi:hypothetical protein